MRHKGRRARARVRVRESKYPPLPLPGRDRPRGRGGQGENPGGEIVVMIPEETKRSIYILERGRESRGAGV